MEDVIVQQFMTDEDLKQAIALDGESYSAEENVGIFSLCKEWYNKNPLMYTVMKHEGEVIGYVNFLPLTKDSYEKYKAGEMHDYEIREDDIETYEFDKHYNALLTSIVIKEDYRNGEAIKLLWDGFLDKLSHLKKLGIEIDNVLADCVSKDGEKFVGDRLGFDYITESKDGKIFEGQIPVLDNQVNTEKENDILDEFIISK